MCGLRKTSLEVVALRVITAPLFISEPVAGRVSTLAKGMALVTFEPCVSRMVQGSPSNPTAAATNLVPSMTERHPRQAESRASRGAPARRPCSRPLRDLARCPRTPAPRDDREPPSLRRVFRSCGRFRRRTAPGASRGRYQTVKSRNRASAENDAGGVVKLKIQHLLLLSDWSSRELGPVVRHLGFQTLVANVIYTAF